MNKLDINDKTFITPIYYEEMSNSDKFQFLRLFVRYEKEVGNTFIDIDEIESSCILILEQENNIIGFTMGDDFGFQVLTAIYVDPKCRGKEYGKDMIEVYCDTYGQIQSIDQGSSEFCNYIRGIINRSYYG